MVIIRPTLRLAKRMRVNLESLPSGLSTTILGDWYAADVVINRGQFILCTSENARISVVLSAAPYATFPDRLPASLSAVLSALGIPKSQIDRELSEMHEIRLAKALNRSLSGTLNQWKYMLDGEVYMGRFHPDDLLTPALALAETPCLVLKPPFPSMVARGLFGIEDPRRAYFQRD